jgi:hypothetical protein
MREKRLRLVTSKIDSTISADNGITISTPPHWGPKLRFLGIPLIILGLILLHDITYEAFRSYYSRHQFDVISLVLNLFTAWPIVFIYLGYFGLIGKWGYVNSIAIQNDKTTFYLIGFLGKEAEAVEMESIQEIKRSKIIGTAGQQKEEVHVLRRYLDKDVRAKLLQMSAKGQ